MSCPEYPYICSRCGRTALEPEDDEIRLLIEKAQRLKPDGCFHEVEENGERVITGFNLPRRLLC